MTEILSAALQYAALGWAVFPCRVRDKRPATIRGFKDATRDPAIIRAWFAGESDDSIVPSYRSTTGAYNVGIATGAASNLVVIDLDKADGIAQWETLVDIQGEIRTRIARTGSGGRHVLFEHPGFAIRNRASILPSVDVRGDGGYIVAPPSIHPSGVAYSWLNDEPVAPMPRWVLDWLSADVSPADPEPVIDPRDHIARDTGTAASLSAYVESALRGEVERVRRAPQGTRNDTLNRAAFSLGQLVTSGAIEEAAVVDSLTAAARAVGLEDEEIAATIASGIKGGSKRPRSIPTPRPGAARPGGSPPPPEEPPHEVDASDATTSSDILVVAPRTDAGNAECFYARHGQTIRYCVTLEKWLYWAGSVWEVDETGRASRLMLETVRARRDAANRLGTTADNDADRDRAKRLFAFALSSENTSKIAAALKAAQVLEPLATKIDQYDRDQFRMVAGDRSINLRTLDVQAPDPTHYVTMRAGAALDPAATCPRWMQFLAELWPDSPEMVAYIQRAIGYCLTGSTREHAFFLLVGAGRNGKSTLLNILRRLLGDYAGVASFQTFDADKRNDSSNDLAALRGKRLVTVSETDEDKRLAEARVKGVTGGDPIQCRFLFREFFSYTPTWKVWMAVNYLPAISGTDNGIWSRIHLIQFNQSFVGREDKDLESKLSAELPGILNWALEGARQWLDRGLEAPAVIRDATRAYREDSDIVGQWIRDRCEVAPDARLLVTPGFKDYSQWSKDSGYRYPLTARKWSRRLQEKGYTAGHGMTGNYLAGLRLTTEV